MVAEHPIPSSLFHPISISTSTSTTMVSFHVPPPIVTDASNDETMLSDELLVGDDKKRYRMTPHPNSKQAVRVGDPHGKLLSDISNMDACVSTIPSVRCYVCFMTLPCVLVRHGVPHRQFLLPIVVPLVSSL
jgi:hypothetical protein